MQKVLIDTDIAIDFLRGDESVKSHIINLWQKNAAYISLLSIYELHAGMREKEQEATDSFIHACQIVDLNIEICQQAAATYRDNRKAGKTLTTVDCLLSATAKRNKYKIYTRNLKHYPEKNLIYSPKKK